MSGDGGGFNFEHLYYLSLHTLDTKTGVQYARTRISRELLDCWLNKKLAFNGRKFDDSSVTLTVQDRVMYAFEPLQRSQCKVLWGAIVFSVMLGLRSTVLLLTTGFLVFDIWDWDGNIRR